MSSAARDLRRLERALRARIAEHGPQGWWPIRAERELFAPWTDLRKEHGYHPGEYDFPRTRRGRWEITVGAVLTQNTTWLQVERALESLETAGLTSPEALLATDPAVLGAHIRPAGYFNQKSRYLRAVAAWFTTEDPQLAASPHHRATLTAARPRLLAVRGVGPETADSILLYAYSLPTFVIDAYTRRVLAGLGLVDPRLPYETLRAACEASLTAPTAVDRVCLWQEAHAALVATAKAQRREPLASLPEATDAPRPARAARRRRRTPDETARRARNEA